MKKTKTTEDPMKDTIVEIRAQFGEESIVMLDQKPNVDIDAISTGSIGLDYAIGIGGFPRGRLVEVFGPESSGKTTLALHVVAEAQKAGGVCAFVDAEHALDPQYAKKIGVQTDRLLVSQPNGGEEALKITDALVNSGKVSVVVIDSVAALVPKAEIEGEIGDQHMAGQARLMSQACRMLTASIAKTGTLVLFINQIRTDIGAWSPGGPKPMVTAGGRALKFYASVRVEIKRIAQVKKGEEIVGSRVKVKVVKNKVAAPFKDTEFDILYNEGISRESELLVLGEKLGIVSKAGAAYRYGEIPLGRGYDTARLFIKNNEKERTAIIEEIQAKLKQI